LGECIGVTKEGVGDAGLEVTGLEESLIGPLLVEVVSCLVGDTAVSCSCCTSRSSLVLISCILCNGFFMPIWVKMSSVSFMSSFPVVPCANGKTIRLSKDFHGFSSCRNIFQC